MAKKRCNYPSIVKELARTRIEYEKGRFLTSDIVALPREVRKDVTKWIVEGK